MSVFSDIDIKRALLDGHIVCRPLRIENIKGSSIDLTLGEYFWRCDADPNGVFNPYDESEIDRYFAGPFRAKPYASVYEKIADTGMHRNNWPRPGGRDYWAPARYEEIDGKITLLEKAHWETSKSAFKNIPDDWPVIVLRPRERILGHSHEFVGVWSPGTTMLKARSSSGRVGMKVCDDAGWGDPDFINRWTWELRNDNDEAIVIPVGERMAQLVVFETGPVQNGYGRGAGYDGKYQEIESSVDGLIASWTPEKMLPRSWKDERQEPLPLESSLYQATLAELAALA